MIGGEHRACFIPPNFPKQKQIENKNKSGTRTHPLALVLDYIRY